MSCYDQHVAVLLSLGRVSGTRYRTILIQPCSTSSGTVQQACYTLKDYKTDESGCTEIGDSILLNAEAEEMREIAKGLSAIAPAKAIWKLSESDLVTLGGNKSPAVGANVKIVKWVNQNDVLGHPNVKAFFTQGGTNSFNEASHLLNLSV